MLELRALRGGYGAIEVLRGLSMKVEAGEIVALLGSNGAGKSTLNNTVCGLQRAFSGSVLFEAREITRDSPAEIVAAGLIQVPEGRRVFPNLTVHENLQLGSYRRGRERRAQNLERVFGIFPKLRERLAQKAGTLSGGEQQMLAIGRALMGEPRLLILDEPSLGLSPLLVEELFELIGRLNGDGLSILLVEQNVGQSLEIAHRAYVMENGAIAFQGTPAALLANAELTRAYLGI
jgi:branched-chain amino acid transport system ATP-binding protein